MSEHETDNRQRFYALFASYGPDIVAYCGWRAGSASDAQDAVAEVFLTTWRRLDDVPEGDAARIWLYATARRVIANQRPSARRRGENDVVHEIAVAWGKWTYTVTYSGLGATAAPKAPANARPLSELTEAASVRLGRGGAKRIRPVPTLGTIAHQLEEAAQSLAVDVDLDVVAQRVGRIVKGDVELAEPGAEVLR